MKHWATWCVMEQSLLTDGGTVAVILLAFLRPIFTSYFNPLYNS